MYDYLYVYVCEYVFEYVHSYTYTYVHIHRITRILYQRGPCHLASWDDPMSLTVPQDSMDTIPRGPGHWGSTNILLRGAFHWAFRDNPMVVRVGS